MNQKEEFQKKQLQVLKKETQIVIDNTRDEMFDIQEASKKKSLEFYNDRVGLPESITLLTRAKVHREADRILQCIKRLKVDETTRLERLVTLHLSQIKRLEPISYTRNLEFYQSMLAAIQLKVRWMRALLLKIPSRPH